VHRVHHANPTQGKFHPLTQFTFRRLRSIDRVAGTWQRGPNARGHRSYQVRTERAQSKRKFAGVGGCLPCLSVRCTQSARKRHSSPLSRRNLSRSAQSSNCHRDAHPRFHWALFPGLQFYVIVACGPVQSQAGRVCNNTYVVLMVLCSACTYLVPAHFMEYVGCVFSRISCPPSLFPRPPTAWRVGHALIYM
jgi:hypothetical protein